MTRNLIKIFSTMGIVKYSTSPQNVGSGSSGDRSSATVRPEPGTAFVDYDAWLVATTLVKYSTSPQNVGSGSSGDRSSATVRPEPGAAFVDYDAWLDVYPSALSSFDQMMSVAKGKRIVVFLDYDGTLSPIVDDPELAFMSEAMRSTLREVAGNFPTAIISGRGREKVQEFVQLSNVYYAGSHGMDIMAPPKKQKPCDSKYQTRTVDKNGNEVTIFQPAQGFLHEMREILNELKEQTRDIKGVSVEDNMFCVSVHFRVAREEDYDLVDQKVKLVISEHPKFHTSRGRKVLEVRPSIKWNKGHALEYLLETLGFADSSDVLPMYIGDDRTDEDAFKVIEERGEGFPIVVSSKPKESIASYSLRDPSEVRQFLSRLVRWRRNSSASKPAT